MAVFGFRGKVESQIHKILDFQIRYIVNFNDGPRYRLRVAITGTIGDDEEDDEIDLVQSGLLDEDERQKYFKEAILSLTQQVQIDGVEATMRSFFMPESAPSDLVNGVEAPNIGSRVPSTSFIDDLSLGHD
jgi:hypothetical protein